MDSKKAEKLEKHKKEMRRRSYMDILFGMAIIAVVGTVLWGPVSQILTSVAGLNTAMAAVSLLTVLGVLVYFTPVIHYREKQAVRSNRDRDYYLDRGFENVPMINLLESEGWEEKNKTEDKIVLETYPSYLHKLFRKKSSMEIEILEKSGNQEIAVLRQDGKDIEKLKTTVESEENGSLLKTTGISLQRYSLSHIELLLIILPTVKNAYKEAAEEKLEFIDENLQYGLSQFKLEEK